MFIETESTPNPQTLKFLPGRDVTGAAIPCDFTSADAAAGASPLAERVFAVEGVARVYLGADFLSVTKSATLDWAHVKPAILAAIMDHFTSGAPTLSASAPGADVDVYEGEAAEIVEQIQQLLETRVRPAVAQDGGDILFHSWEHDTGVVRLTMRGACAGCPSSTMTLKQGVENMLKHYVPEVRAVEQV